LHACHGGHQAEGWFAGEPQTEAKQKVHEPVHEALLELVPDVARDVVHELKPILGGSALHLRARSGDATGGNIGDNVEQRLLVTFLETGLLDRMCDPTHVIVGDSRAAKRLLQTAAFLF
jgi:hypothetical protein